MADNRSLTRLFEAIGHQDWDSSKELALGIALKEDSKGNRHVARKLRGALNGARPAKTQETNGTSSGQFLLSQAMVRCPDGPSLSEIKLRKKMRTDLDDVISEWKAESSITAAGLTRRSRLLFYGPPGCGKTVTASAIARELKLPSYIVRFNALIGAYLGQTALNLREIFQFVSTTPCVLILDEIDVLGKKRGSQMDVGELDRIVVGLMQELDLTNTKGLIIGASNLSAHLDDALWRRFDLKMEFLKPTQSELLSFTRQLGKRYSVPITSAIKNQLKPLRDYASAEQLIQDHARRKIIRRQQSNAK